LLQHFRNCVVFVLTLDVLIWYKFVSRRAVACCLSEFSVFSSVSECPFPSVIIKSHMFTVDVCVSYTVYTPLRRIFYPC
jgi:hypothetical protein